MYKDYLKFYKILDKKFSDICDFLKSDLAPKRYAAVLDAFNAKDDILNSNRRILGQLRPKVESSLKKSGISKYKACKDLGINPGNFYAYMNGDNSKISEEIAYAVINLGDDSTNHIAVEKSQSPKEDKPKDEFYLRNGHRYIDIKVTDNEYKLLQQYAKEKNKPIEDLIKENFIEYIKSFE